MLYEPAIIFMLNRQACGIWVSRLAENVHGWLVQLHNVNCVFTGGKLSLNKTRFRSIEQIPQHLLESVATCYSQRIQACKWCFLTHLPSTQKQLQSMLIPTSRICGKCLHNSGAITVIPASGLCETSCYGNFVAIPPTPTHKNNIKAFHYCKKYEEMSKHKRCLLLTKKVDPWYPHSIEEMVIWTFKYKEGTPNSSSTSGMCITHNVYSQLCVYVQS